MTLHVESRNDPAAPAPSGDPARSGTPFWRRPWVGPLAVLVVLYLYTTSKPFLGVPEGKAPLQPHGSGVLTRWLLQNDLLDELNLIVMPVVVGAGTRLFPEAGVDVALELVEARPFPKGVVAQVYRTAGRPVYPA